MSSVGLYRRLSRLFVYCFVLVDKYKYTSRSQGVFIQLRESLHNTSSANILASSTEIDIRTVAVLCSGASRYYIVWIFSSLVDDVALHLPCAFL